MEVTKRIDLTETLRLLSGDGKQNDEMPGIFKDFIRDKAPHLQFRTDVIFELLQRQTSTTR
jgi:hypothetical protein